MQDLKQFDPNVEKLQALVAESAGIKEVDLDNPTQLETVKKARLKLRDARVLIEKTGKAFREDALKYQRDVIAKEKELIAIIEPEETRLKLFEKSAEVQKEKRLRIAQLPERRARLEKEGFPVDESILLAMDSVAFETHFNNLVAEKNRKDREEIDRKEREQREAADKLEREKREEEDRKTRERREYRSNKLIGLGLTLKGDAFVFEDVSVKAAFLDLDEVEFDKLIANVTPLINTAKQAAEDRAKKEKEENDERIRKEERDRIEREAQEKERLEREEQAKLEKKRAYQTFLKENGWTKETAADFKEENTGAEVVLWKKVAVFKI